MTFFSYQNMSNKNRFMESTKSYYLYELQEKYTGQDWMSVIPRTYSIDGNGTMPRILKSENEGVCSGSVQPTTPTHDYSLDYLTIESLEDNNTIYLQASNSSVTRTVSASTDNGATWSEYTSSTGDSGTTLATLNAGEKLLIKGQNDRYGKNSYGNQFRTTEQFIVYGNIMSLISGDSFVNADELTATFTFYCLFRECTGLTSAENLVLPATTLSIECYQNMFQNCTSLTAAPALPAATLARACYSGMFGGCTSLTAAPALPATTLADDCYSGMFDGCTNLTTAPELPVTTLANYCYMAMLRGCTSLTVAPELPARTLTQGCYQNMFQNCTSLTTPPELPATILADFCYTGMFSDCTSLTVAPELPATTLASSCYQAMFARCTSLTTAPQLPATTLANGCYWYMFLDCTNLTTAPELPATTLIEFCYYRMFEGCTRLSYIKCLATNISASNCTFNWVGSVSSTGTFVKKAAMTGWTRGKNGIPTGWTVQNA